MQITIGCGRTVSQKFQSARTDFGVTFDPKDYPNLSIPQVRDMLQWLSTVAIVQQFSRLRLNQHATAYETLFGEPIANFVKDYKEIPPAQGELVDEAQS